MATTTLSYTMQRGTEFERLVIVKNRRTRRVVYPDTARCVVQLTGSTKEIPVTISSEGGIKLYLSPADTADFPVGTYNFDITAPVDDGYWNVVAKGTIEVTNLGNIAPLEEASASMPLTVDITFRRGEDFKLQFDWTDTDGDIITAADGYMQAKDGSDTVIDLRWFATKPNEASILALPAVQRGYLAPYAGSSLEMHISDANSVAAGEYAYDLFVKGDNDDWTCIAAGALTVEAAISTRPE